MAYIVVAYVDMACVVMAMDLAFLPREAVVSLQELRRLHVGRARL